MSCRFLVHRYSVLQRAAAAENGDIDEPLEINHTQNGKIEFHDDSDEVCGRLCNVRSVLCYTEHASVFH